VEKDDELQKEIDVVRYKVFIVALVALSLFGAAASGTRAQVGRIGPPKECARRSR